MVEKAMFCCFKPCFPTPEEAQKALGLHFNGFPKEEFAFIEIEDVVRNKYFITTYGRILTTSGRELFPEPYTSNENTNLQYYRIELSCTSYYKRRKFLVHRLVAEAFIPKTQDDIINNRNIVNHKYNRDGRCNYAWNLEWTTYSENTIHALNTNICDYKTGLYDISPIEVRRCLINYNQDGDSNPKSRISEFQANLICFAYFKLGYSVTDSAIYAWLEGNQKDKLLVYSIINGYAWQSVSINYGVEPKSRKTKSSRSPVRNEFMDDYQDIVNSRVFS